MTRRFAIAYLVTACLLYCGQVAAFYDADLTPVDHYRPLRKNPVALVENGRRPLPVVCSDNRRDIYAAEYLAKSIFEITGRRPRVVIASPLTALLYREGFFVFSGEDVFLRRGGYRVRAAENRVEFSGWADYAVFDFVERVLGTRTYWDENEGGRSVIRKKAIVLNAFEYDDSPEYDYRSQGSYDRLPVFRTAKVGRERAGVLRVHAPHHWRTDPDVPRSVFALYLHALDATTHHPTAPMLCYSNPETLEYYERRIDEHIRGVRDSGGIVDVKAKLITVSPWDVEYACRCRRCMALYDRRDDYELGGASPIVWGSFLRPLAEWAKTEHPDYTIAFLPYWNYCDVPDGFDLADLGNCEAMVCSMPGLARFKSPQIREAEETLLRDWRRVTGRPVVSWHYSCWPADSTPVPYAYGYDIVRHLDAMRGIVSGSFVCGGCDMSRFALSLYIWNRAMWKPRLDVGKVYDEFSRRLFGPAAADIRAILELEETAWNPDTLDYDLISAQEICRLLNNANQTIFNPSVGGEMPAASTPSLQNRRALRYFAAGFGSYEQPLD